MHALAVLRHIDRLERIAAIRSPHKRAHAIARLLGLPR